MTALLQLVQFCVDRRRGQLRRLGQRRRGGLSGVQLGGCARHLLGERCGFFDPLVEHHGGVQILLRRVLQQCGLEQGHAPAAQRVLGQAEDRVGVADLEHVDLEPGEDRAFYRLRQPKIKIRVP